MRKNPPRRSRSASVPMVSRATRRTARLQPQAKSLKDHAGFGSCREFREENKTPMRCLHTPGASESGFQRGLRMITISKTDGSSRSAGPCSLADRFEILHVPSGFVKSGDHFGDAVEIFRRKLGINRQRRALRGSNALAYREIAIAITQLRETFLQMQRQRIIDFCADPLLHQRLPKFVAAARAPITASY